MNPRGIFNGASLGLTTEEQTALENAWGKIPADRKPIYDAAFWVVVAFRDMNTPAPPWIETETGRTYWCAGYADRVISAVESFAEVFCNVYRNDTDGSIGLAGEQAALSIVQRINDWFKKQGILSCEDPLEWAYNEAKRRHNIGLELHKSQEAEARNQGNNKNNNHK